MAQLVSILIPAYNAEKWISDTIKSSLNQTWPKKEIIIVDDGSTDNTLQIARQFESKSVKVMTQENVGACVARNKALSFAQGDYIQWLDADDLLAHDKISQQLKENESGKNTRTLLTSAFGTFYYRHQKARFIPNSLWQDLEPIEWILKKFNDNVWMNPASWLVSRKLTELAGPWDERLFRDQDGEYICRVVSASDKVKFIPAAKSYYRISNLGSLSKGTSDKACKSLFLSLSLCIGYLRSLEDSERTRSACLMLLQRWLYHFYPEKPELHPEKDELHPEKDELLFELLHKINDLARELGGNLLPPKLSWKYSLIKKIFGLKVAMKVRDIVSKAKLLAYINWDRLIYELSVQSKKKVI